MDPQVVLISGGSRGLGAAIVDALLNDGHSIATFSRKSTDFMDRCKSNYADRFVFSEVDASDTNALHAFTKSTYETFGRIDTLINNAAVAIDGVLALSRDEDISLMLDVNLKAALVLAREASRYMLLQNSGTIINIASIIAMRGFSGLSTYAATKAGMVGMTKALARELGARGICVNAIAPGYLDTEMSESLSDNQRAQIIRRTPLGRLGTANDVVPWIKFLLTPESKFVTGEVFTIDGGASV
ncbi:MAG: SDR family oxidoreductase [Planctomycetales bacterium]|nr:SDR family oxidoreductase [Planctomycetales bacterium]